MQAQTGEVREKKKKKESLWQQLVNYKQAGSFAGGWMGVDIVKVVRRETHAFTTGLYL